MCFKYVNEQWGNFQLAPILFSTFLSLTSRPRQSLHLFVYTKQEEVEREKNKQTNKHEKCSLYLFICSGLLLMFIYLVVYTWTTSLTSLLACLLYLLYFHSQYSIVIQLMDVIITYTMHALCANLSILLFIYRFFPAMFAFYFSPFFCTHFNAYAYIIK